MDGIVAYLTDGPGISLGVQLLLCAVSFAGSTVTATLGLGGGGLVLATMALYFPPAVLIPLHGVVQIGSNLGRALLMMRSVVFAIIPAFAIGTAIGAIAGAKAVVSLPAPLLQTIIAAFLLYAVWGPGFRFKGGKPSRAKFFGVGVLAAFVTMFIGATGPLISPFVREASPDRHHLVATHGALMSLQHGFKIVAFGLLGFAFWRYIPFLAAMLASGFAGTMVGRMALNRLPETGFRIGFNLLLTALATGLLWRALPRLAAL